MSTLRTFTQKLIVLNRSLLDKLDKNLQLESFIIQQIVTMPISGKEALNICHPT